MTWTNDISILYPHKHLVCYSGGHSSALVALEVANRFGTENLLLVNHDIHSSSEHHSIKTFKKEVAAFIGVPITYVNMENWDTKDQFDVVIEAGAFKVGNGSALCTNRMKTRPFEKYLKESFPAGTATIYYGFDRNEFDRIQRRSSHLGNMGYKTDYPLALWSERHYYSTLDIGIEPPTTYSNFKHANCIGCLKASKQHWYTVFCLRPDIWEKAKHAEHEIGYTILRYVSLEQLEPLFKLMQSKWVPASEHIKKGIFWARVRECEQLLKTQPLDDSDDNKPCECII